MTEKNLNGSLPECTMDHEVMKMKYIDMHCDTLMLAWLKGQTDIYDQPEMMVDIKRLLEGGCKAQFFAIFLPSPGMKERMGKAQMDDDDYIAQLAHIFRSTLDGHGETVAQAGNLADILANERAGKVSAVLTMEDGRSVDGRMEKLERYYDLGVRVLGLTWNQENCFGSPNSRDAAVMGRGLTDFGKDAIVRMNELGMGIDVSHLSDGGFWDVARLTRKPFFATHSNCRSLNPHPRSMTDEMIRALADKGGVMGVNLCPAFLVGDTENNRATCDMLTAQLRHMIKAGGEDCAAIGTDFDGMNGELEIGSADRMPMLFTALEKAGFTPKTIEKIAFRNAERVLADVL